MGLLFEPHFKSKVLQRRVETLLLLMYLVFGDVLRKQINPAFSELALVLPEVQFRLTLRRGEALLFYSRNCIAQLQEGVFRDFPDPLALEGLYLIDISAELLLGRFGGHLHERKQGLRLLTSLGLFHFALILWLLESLSQRRLLEEISA